MNHRSLKTALLLCGKDYHRRIDSALQERHTMTRLAYVLEDLLSDYNRGALPGQKVTTLSEVTSDKQFAPCFETAIIEDAGGIFDAWKAGPLFAIERLNAVMQDECDEQESVWNEMTIDRERRED